VVECLGAGEEVAGFGGTYVSFGGGLGCWGVGGEGREDGDGKEVLVNEADGCV